MGLHKVKTKKILILCAVVVMLLITTQVFAQIANSSSSGGGNPLCPICTCKANETCCPNLKGTRCVSFQCCNQNQICLNGACVIPPSPSPTSTPAEGNVGNQIPLE